MRTFKAIDLSGATDVRLRMQLRQLAKQSSQSGVVGTIPAPSGGSTGPISITYVGLQFQNDWLYGALLAQGTGWSRNRLSFQPYTSTVPLVIDTVATKRAAPFVVLDQAHGYVVQDAQAIPHFWQFRASPQGIPFCEDIGSVASNPSLRLS